MPPSYRLVDYSIRPAKYAERRMMCDSFRRLSKFASLESYQYVGFGSVWFSDFNLFHRALGIEKMISIERMEAHRERFLFNRPFRGVDIRFGESARELPNINWRLRTITWLDYDDPLCPPILADVRTIATNIAGGSLLAVSVQCENPPLGPPDEDGERQPVKTVDEFRSVFGPARTPIDMTSKDLVGWNVAATARNAVTTEIADALSAVNASRPDVQRLEFRQIMALEYADGAKMTTVAGVFVDKGQNSIFSSCGFDELSFYRSGNDALRIEVPKLTPREMRELESRLPMNDPAAIDPGVMPQRDAVAFARLYRYLPSFASFEP
jgi:hypothetical protein